MATIEKQVIKDGILVSTESFTGPSGWHDLTREHLIFWASAMCSGVTALRAKVILAALLYEIPAKTLTTVLDRKERFRLSLSIGFLFKRNQLHRWLLPKFSFRMRTYHGPKSRLSNITALEFSLCELCYEQFDRTKRIEWLEMLAAILFRPKRWFGIDDDIRQALTTNSTEARAIRFRKLPERIKWAIYLNYEGCRNYIIDNNKEIFKKGEPGNAPAKLTPWSKIVQSGAGGIFGTLTETERSNAHKFLSELNTRLKEKKDSTPS